MTEKISCTVCGGNISYDPTSNTGRCSGCGVLYNRDALNTLLNADQSQSGVTTEPPAPMLSSSGLYAPLQANPSPSIQSKATTVNPSQPQAGLFAENWSTKIGAAIGGILCAALLNSFLNWMDATATTVGAFLLSLVFSIAYSGATIYYALSIYPSLFGDEPKLTKASTASFLNGFFGGIIFGCLWNSCLTRKRKGISQYVVTVFCAMAILLYAYWFSLYV